MKLLSSLSFAYCFLSLVSSQSTVTLSPPNGTVSVCQGKVETITCNVTYSPDQMLLWAYSGGPGGGAVNFGSGNTDPQQLPPFNFTLQCQNNVTLISTGVVNVSTLINGSTLECRNTLSIDDSSIRKHINFSVKHSVPISYLHVNAVSSDTLLIIWTGADCIQSYDVFINGANVNTTSGMSLLYNTGGAIGSIDVLVNSVDYYGRAVGNLSTQYQFNKYNFEVEAIISNNMSLVIIIKDKYINQQPAPLSCELTVTNLTQPSMDCLSKRLFVFTNVTEGDVYNYTVTITNVIGSTVKNGSIVLEQTCPPSAQSCCSAFPISHQSCSVSNTESSTPSPTMESCGSNCVLPWIVGVIVGTVVVSLLI